METDEVASWDQLDLKDNLLRGVYGYGFENPSPIQKKAIKPIMTGKDVIAQAQSGTGKTGAFTISTIQRIDETLNEIQGLILAPTRELAIQIHSVASTMGTFVENLSCSLLIGGRSIDLDVKENQHKNNQTNGFRRSR